MSRKTAVTVIAIALILTTIVTYIVMNGSNTPSVIVSVEPDSIAAGVWENFTINIAVKDIIDLFGYQVKLKWNATLLAATSVVEESFLKNGGDTLFIPIVNGTEGYALVDCSLLGLVSGINGSGNLFSVQFGVQTNGNCQLDLYDVKLLNSDEILITHFEKHGRFSSIP